MNIYVANIPYQTTEDELKELFEEHGDVSSVKIVIDKITNRSRGFGFVEMADTESGKNAIEKLDGHSFQGKELMVNEARPKDNSRSGSGGRSGGGGYGNKGGGGYNKRW